MSEVPSAREAQQIGRQIEQVKRIEPLYTYDDVAALFRVSVKTVMEWAKAGKIPSPFYVGGVARFTATDFTLMREGNVSLPGTFVPLPSPRASAAKKIRRQPTSDQYGLKPNGAGQKKKGTPAKKPAKKKGGAS